MRQPCAMNLTEPAKQPSPANAGRLPAVVTGSTAVNAPAATIAQIMTLATRLQEQGDTAAAIALYRKWLDVGQQYRHIAWFNLGTLLGDNAQHQEACAAYQQALDEQPAFWQAHLNLGHQLEHLAQTEQALSHWQKVIDAAGNKDSTVTEALHLHALNNAARLLETQRQLERAEAYMVRSLQCNCDQPDVIQHYVHIRQKQCKWPVYEPVGDLTHNQMLMATSALAMMGLSDDPALQLLSAYRFVNAKVPPPADEPLFNKARRILQPGRKMRVGYLSGDLCLHAMGLLIPELLELHDRNRIEVFGFCWSRDDGTQERRRIINALDHHISIGELSDADAAQLIAQLEIDVLVDLQGLSSGARPAILGKRPAPIQVGYLGLPATSAVPGVSHMIGDAYATPASYHPYCTERIMQVPACYQVSDRRRLVGEVPTRAQCELPEDAFVFCSFNNNHKFTEEMFSTWMHILHEVDNSVLWLLADNQWAKANMQSCASKHGVNPGRLIFAPRVAPADFRARLRLADLFLDTYPYNAGATASDVLWMGTPVLTLSGKTYISRMAGSLLTNVGLPDLITTSLDAYCSKAIQLGNEPNRTRSYRRYLDEFGRSSALFDTPALVAGIEDGFFELCANHDARVQQRDLQ